ncbi:hypothetical protein [Corallococcus sp. EGB]|uniref:hypothetical protein n=1 Tax=Corallococcus sp. EGB TaxID=1521117 RepID=UPI001CBEFC21|nr:hypothetical protein [Corallococcus sp. EGB]
MDATNPQPGTEGTALTSTATPSLTPAAHEQKQSEAKAANNDVSMADVIHLITTVAQAVMPLATTAIEARAKFMAAQPDLNTLQEKNAHERALDNQRRSWEFYATRDKMVGRLMLTWTIALVFLIAGGVFAIQQKVIDQQSALTLGLFVAGSMGWAGSKVTGRAPPPPGSGGP